MIHVHVYRVGLLQTIPQGRWSTSRGYLARQMKARNWRAIRAHLKGVRAEHYGCSHNVGTAWFSERAAIRRAANFCHEAAN